MEQNVNISDAELEREIGALEAEVKAETQAAAVKEKKEKPPQDKGKKQRVGAYRAFAVIFFLLAAGGLFLGLLGKLSPRLASSFTAGGALAGFLNDTLLGAIIVFFKALFSGLVVPEGTPIGEMVNVIASGILLIFICITVLTCFIAMIVTFASRRSARSSMHASGIFILLSYGGLLVYYFCQNCIAATMAGAGLSLALIDVPCAIVAGITLIVLLVTTLVESKGFGVLNVLFTLLTLGMLFLFYFPGSSTAIFASTVIENFTGGASLLFSVALVITVALLYFNVIVSVVRVCAKGSYVFDLIRFLFQLFAFGFLVVTTVNAETGAFGFMEGNMLIACILLGLSFAAAVVAIIAVSAFAVRKAKRKYAEATAPAQTTDFVLVETKPEEPAAKEEKKEEKKEEPQPKAEPRPQPQDPKTEFERYMEAMARGEQPDPAPQPQPTPQQQQQAHYQPPQYQQAQHQPPYNPQPQPQPHQPPRPAQPIYHRPVYTPPVQPQYRTAPAAQRPTAPHAAPHAAPQQHVTPPTPPQQPHTPNYSSQNYGSVNTQYTYDPFINTLTPAEKNEFGDIFIANKYGIGNQLPAYVIGGDNSEFFRKVFIYLGRYRKYISRGLLDKIYAFITK